MEGGGSIKGGVGDQFEEEGDQRLLECDWSNNDTVLWIAERSKELSQLS